MKDKSAIEMILADAIDTAIQQQKEIIRLKRVIISLYILIGVFAVISCLV